MAILNIEPLCAKWGRQMIDTNGGASISDQENTVTNALAVLAENGLYAMAVFLLSCHKKDYGERVLTHHLAGLWKDIGLLTDGPQDKGAMLFSVQAITLDLPKLMLARKAAEQAMVFARYHAKAEVTAPGGRP